MKSWMNNIRNEFDLILMDNSGVLHPDMYNVSWTTGEILRHCGYKGHYSHKLWQAHTGNGNSTLAENMKEFGIDKITPEEFWILYKRFYKESYGSIGVPPAYEGALYTIKKLKKVFGKHITLWSYHPQEFVEKEFPHNDIPLSKNFGLVLAGINSKSRALLDASRYFGVPTERIIVVTDTIGDIHEARKAGAKSIAVGTGYQYPSVISRKGKPDYGVVRSIVDVPYELSRRIVNIV